MPSNILSPLAHQQTNMRPVGKVVARVAYNCGNENMIRKIDGTFQPLMEIVQCTESYVFLEKDAKGGVNSITNSYVLMGNGDMGKFNECFGTSYDKLIRCQSVCIDLSYACQGKCFSECGAGQCETDLFNCLNLCAPDDYTCQNACYDKYNECTAPFYPCLDQCYPDCYTDYNTCYISCCGSTLARVQECFEEYYSRENTGILATTGKDLTAAKLRSVVHTEKPIAGYLGDGDSLTNHTEVSIVFRMIHLNCPPHLGEINLIQNIRPLHSRMSAIKSKQHVKVYTFTYKTKGWNPFY